MKVELKIGRKEVKLFTLNYAHIELFQSRISVKSVFVSVVPVIIMPFSPDN